MDVSRVPAHPPFARAIIHIGTERTGSTTIQRALSRNRDVLLHHGALYPRSLGRSSHGALATICQSIEPRDEFARNAVRRYGGTLEEARAAVAERFAAEVVAHLDSGAPPSVLVISSEHLHSRLVTLEEKQRLADFLAPWVRDVEIYAYLRPQADLAKSVYNFRIKNGGTGGDEVFPALDSRQRRYYDYTSMLDEYARIFGDASVHPVLFEPRSFPERDVVRDLLERSGLPREGFEFRDSTNESLSAPALEFMRRFNAEVPRRIDDKSQVVRRTVDRFVAQYEGPAFAVDGHEAADFQRQFDEDNETLRSRWFPERETLFPPVRTDTVPVEVSESELLDLSIALYVASQDDIRAERVRALIIESRLRAVQGRRRTALRRATDALAWAGSDSELVEEAESRLAELASAPRRGSVRWLVGGVRRRLRTLVRR
ncbi:hypothetical protein [Demequina mangrovi]|uniref:hypothetical protein n=1 Tax=Demequina mangrovi TaxID=1043493 RepID=UPI0005A98F3A|nr:hypothetical protein [Demequina mangrovi]